MIGGWHWRGRSATVRDLARRAAKSFKPVRSTHKTCKSSVCAEAAPGQGAAVGIRFWRHAMKFLHLAACAAAFALCGCNENELKLPPEAIEACDDFVQRGMHLHALKRQGAGYEEGLIEFRKAGINLDGPPPSWEGILWKEAFTKTWRSDLAFGYRARDMCLDRFQQLFNGPQTEERTAPAPKNGSGTKTVKPDRTQVSKPL
jgi:hypothetical protein